MCCKHVIKDSTQLEQGLLLKLPDNSSFDWWVMPHGTVLFTVPCKVEIQVYK